MIKIEAHLGSMIIITEPSGLYFDIHTWKENLSKSWKISYVAWDKGGLDLLQSFCLFILSLLPGFFQAEQKRL